MPGNMLKNVYEHFLQENLLYHQKNGYINYDDLYSGILYSSDGKNGLYAHELTWMNLKKWCWVKKTSQKYTNYLIQCI